MSSLRRPLRTILALAVTGTTLGPPGLSWAEEPAAPTANSTRVGVDGQAEGGLPGARATTGEEKPAAREAPGDPRPHAGTGAPEPPYFLGRGIRPGSRSGTAKLTVGGILIGLGAPAVISGAVLLGTGLTRDGETPRTIGVAIGAPLLAIGGAHLIPAAILLASGVADRRRALGPIFLTRRELELQTGSARRMALGGGISAAISAALVAAGAGMLAAGAECLRESVCEQLFMAGASLVGINAASLVVSAGIMGAGIARLRALRRAERRGPGTRAEPAHVLAAPWATSNSAGISLSGRF